MENSIKLIDYFKVQPDASLSSLTKREKITLIDNYVGSDDSQGLLVTYDLSHSGRRINNRIYPTKGQQDGVDTVLSPYPKPILLHHDGHEDPVGRFIHAEWQDLSSEALGFFTDINAFMEVKHAFQSDQPKKIYKAMKKHGLLTNDEWPGLGRMRVQARITDKEAIEKFLDGRYITFSAGSTTDRHVCSICDEDWTKGDICEHRHGRIYDGEVCVFITGTFKVMEGSVVNMPADDLSQVLSMEMTGHNALEGQDACHVDLSTIYLTDSTFSFTENSMQKATTVATVETTDEEATAEEVEATEDSTEAVNEDNESVEEETAETTVEAGAVDSEEDNEIVSETEETITTEDTDNEDLGGVVNAVIAKLTELGMLNVGAKEEDGDTQTSEVQDDTVSVTTKASEEEVEEETQKEVVDKADYISALRCISEIEDRLAAVLSAHAELLEKSFSDTIDTERLEVMNAWFDSIKSSDSEEETVLESKKVVEVKNPSVSSADSSTPGDGKKALGDYEKKIIDQYNEIKEADGAITAENYLESKSRYLPRGFHPSNY